MKWENAKIALRAGLKITRPNWEAGHFWVMSNDGYERILCHNGTNASVHIMQTEVDNWEIWREPITTERILKEIDEFIMKTYDYPNIIKFGNLSKDFPCVGMKLYGMEIQTDDSLHDGEFEIGYKKPKKEKSLSDKRHTQVRGYVCNPAFYEKDVKKAVMEFVDGITGKYPESRNAIVAEIIKHFGEKLC